jgi:hypothetical protein
MAALHLRIFAIGFALILGIAFLVPWSHMASARPAVADFEPSMSAEAAAARVSAAQEASRAIQQTSPFTSTAPASLPLAQTVYFPSTGHHVSNRSGFLDFWRSNGQMALGYPLTEEIDENGRIVQYFERARLEYHPELVGTPFQVQLGLIGSEATAGRVFETAEAMPNARYFPETQHNLYGKFLLYWEKRGGVARFGLPISEEFDEVSPMDGQVRRTQYFERARFEYHPEDMESFYRQQEAYNGIWLATLHEIELGDLGRQVLQQRNISSAPVAQLANVPNWSSELWPRRIEVSISKQWLYAYEGDLQVYAAPVSTGRDGFNTPIGNFAVYDKLRVQTMVGDAGGETWNVPSVPWVMYIYGGVALHGTYWHDNFGTGYRPSHGCINLNMDDAQWLYQWASIGTPVSVVY